MTDLSKVPAGDLEQELDFRSQQSRDLSRFTEEEIEAELRDRSGVQPLIDTLKACVFALENPVGGQWLKPGDHQFEKAKRLAFELAWRTLPGGSEFEGMTGGWVSLGEEYDEGRWTVPHSTLKELMGEEPNAVRTFKELFVA